MPDGSVQQHLGRVLISDINSVIVIPIDLTGISSGSGSGNASSQIVRIKQDLGDCLQCVKFDTGQEGDVIYVGKNHKLRTSLASETKDNIIYTYVYAQTMDAGTGFIYRTRTATRSSDSATENDFITPPYLYNDLLYAISITPSETLNGVDCAYAAKDERAWGSQQTS
jgi:hypothetical protein